ncbi:hypothetical protein B0H19DRAFT_675648 [Mycena capillaripes]|nr:hypothetical protein B0H19DRAFT_675648 [Mycena capillaripes]
MLQIPSSVFTLVSFSSKGFVGLFGGFCIGAQLALNIVLSGLSEVPKNSLSFATRTTEIFLLPTKCGLSSGTISFPYVAAMGYATVVFAGLFFILRAKGFSHGQVLPDGRSPSPGYPVSDGSPLSRRAVSPARNHFGMGGQPPSPPFDPGSRCVSDKAPRRNRWMWLLLIFVALALVGLGGYIYFTYPDSRTAASLHIIAFLGTQTVSAAERFIQHGWAAAKSLVLASRIIENGWQLSKIILLTLASHSAYILIFTTLRCVCRMILAPLLHLFISFFLLCMAAVASPPLRWILWYYWGCFTVQEVNWHMLRFSSYLSSVAASYFPELSTIIGVIVVHTFAACLQIIAAGFPSIARAVFREISVHPPFVLFGDFIIEIPVFCVWLGHPAVLHYFELGPRWKQWRSFSCKQSRDTVRVTFWRLVQEHRAWKSTQIQDLHELTSGFSNTLLATLKASWETWCTLPLIQQFLIVAPAIIFYSYPYILYILPSTRRMKELKVHIRNWRRQ